MLVHGRMQLIVKPDTNAEKQTEPALAAAIPLRHLTVSVSFWDEPMLAIQSFDSHKSTFALQYMRSPFPRREKSDGVDNWFESREMTLI